MLREQENLCQWGKQENQYVFNSFIKKQGFEDYRMVWGVLLEKEIIFMTKMLPFQERHWRNPAEKISPAAFRRKPALEW